MPRALMLTVRKLMSPKKMAQSTMKRTIPRSAGTSGGVLAKIRYPLSPGCRGIGSLPPGDVADGQEREYDAAQRYEDFAQGPSEAECCGQDQQRQGKQRGIEQRQQPQEKRSPEHGSDRVAVAEAGEEVLGL